MPSDKECFFCGRPISGKATLEHIFGNSFLKYLGIKEEKMFSSMPDATEYSRIKVPAHRHCNNEAGAWFEDYVLGILKSMDSNPELLSSIHINSDDPIIDGLRQVLGQWLAKLYFGLLFWECSRHRHPNPSYQRQLVDMLRDPTFAYLRRCFVEDIGFRVPSSLFYFRVPDPPEPCFRFDFGNGLPHGLFYIRFENHLLVTALGDARLVSEWFEQSMIESLQETITVESENDPIAYLVAVAHCWAVRENLPVAPRLEYTKNRIVDRSREGLHHKPPFDNNAVNLRATELFKNFARKWQKPTA